MTASSPRRRARIIAGSVLVAGLLAVSACSAGQITQTSSQVAAVTGAEASAGPAGSDDTTVALRDLVVAYDGIEGYAAGANAPLVVRLFNQTGQAISLTGVTTPGVDATGNPAVKAASVLLVDPKKATPTGGASEEAASASPGATASPAAEKPAGESSFQVTIPAAGYALLVPGEGPYLLLNKLSAELVNGGSIPVTFTFSDGGTVTVQVPVGLPVTPAPRSPMDIHGEE
ncbi:hypothetical protein ACFQX7_21920 [Luedemannella flava]